MKGSRKRRVAGLLALLPLAAASGCEPEPSTPRVDARYAAAVAEIERLVEHELRDKDLPGISIALIEDQTVVWAHGFGHANREDGTPATAETVHRVGSVSKLFTDIGVMQLVEQGELDLDAPVTTYLPDFQPANPYGEPITLRQLMSHRSGLLREPPVGNYFDDTEPSLAAMVASVNGRPLVYEPGTRVKYSNAGIAVVGYLLEHRSGEPFARYLKRAVLEPMGMPGAAFEPTPEILERLATAYMWTWDGREFEAPTFQLGMAPAGSMYASVLELGQFMKVLFADGRGPGGQVLARETIDTMWTPQYAAAGQTRGFGLGFAIGELDGHRRIGHNGAIYGFATELALLPDEKLGVAVVVTLDAANSVAGRVADTALRAMLAAREGRPIPRTAIPAPVDSARAVALAGRYTNGGRTLDLVERSGRLFLHDRGRYTLRAFGDTLVVDDRFDHGRRLLPLADGRLAVGGDTLARAQVRKPPSAPALGAGLIGEYGWDHNTLYIYEDAGTLHALIEWFFVYPLEQISDDEFAFPDYGLYHGEKLIFTRDTAGRATSVEAANVAFRRRAVGTEAGVTFKIEPLRPVDELRVEALAATPPRESGDFLESDLVDLRSLDPSIRYDIRYATTNNFMDAVFYAEAKAFLQRPAAEALVQAQRELHDHGYGLLIHDAYRPWYVTKMFYDATPAEMKHFVADPAQGSRHNRGAAVDLTLVDLATGQPVEMVGGYDEFSDRSYPEYMGGTSLQRWHRELLRSAMEAQGFHVYEWEWWHFDYGDWRRFPIGNLAFEQLGR